jgi:hypothetical protein
VPDKLRIASGRTPICWQKRSLHLSCFDTDLVTIEN